MRCSLSRVEVLDQSTVGVELWRGSVPTNNDLIRSNLLAELIHVAVVLQVDLNLALLIVFMVRNSKTVLDLDLGLGAGAEKGTDDTVLAIVASEVVVENGEECDGVNVNTRDGTRVHDTRAGGGREVNVKGRGEGFGERHVGGCSMLCYVRRIAERVVEFRIKDILGSEGRRRRPEAK